MPAADPKIRRILAALSTRLSAIDSTGGEYHTDIGTTVIRGRKQLPQPPVAAIYLDRETVTAAAPRRTQIDATVAVEAFAAYGAEQPEDVGCRLLEDIRKAIESPADARLGGLLIDGDQYGIAYSQAEIIYPTEQDSIVGVRVLYSAPYVRSSD